MFTVKWMGNFKPPLAILKLSDIQDIKSGRKYVKVTNAKQLNEGDEVRAKTTRMVNLRNAKVMLILTSNGECVRNPEVEKQKEKVKEKEKSREAKKSKSDRGTQVDQAGGDQAQERPNPTIESLIDRFNKEISAGFECYGTKLDAFASDLIEKIVEKVRASSNEPRGLDALIDDCLDFPVHEPLLVDGINNELNPDCDPTPPAICPEAANPQKRKCAQTHAQKNDVKRAKKMKFLKHVVEVAHAADKGAKLLSDVVKFVTSSNNSKVIIFAENAKAAMDLGRFLGSSRIRTHVLKCAEQAVCVRKANLFQKDKSARVLVVPNEVKPTDVDVHNLTAVINYDVPKTRFTYEERASRLPKDEATPRIVLTVVTEYDCFVSLERLVKCLEDNDQEVPTALADLVQELSYNNMDTQMNNAVLPCP